MNRPGPRLGGPAMMSALAAVFVGAVDLTVISTVLPRIVSDLEINTADIDRYIWVVNAYLLSYIVAIPMVGRLSDLIGRRAAFEAAIAVFLIGSVWSGLSHSLGELIAARAVQGAGGGALLPIAMAVAGDLFPPGERTAALGMVGSIDTLGWVLGPIWGVLILGLVGSAHDAWRWVFWINVPVGIAVALVIHWRLPASGPTGEKFGLRQIDLLGALLLGVSMLLLNLGLSSGGEAGISTGSAFRALGGTRNPLAKYLPWLFAAGLLCLIAFVLWQRRARVRLVPAELFGSRTFVAAQIANFAVGAALIAAMVDVPLTAALLVSEGRVSSVTALLLAPFTLLMAAAAYAGGIVAGRVGERRTGLVGLAGVVIGFVGVWLGLRHGNYPWMIPGLAVAGAGFGLVVAPIGSSAIDNAAPEQRGIAAASTVVFRLLGMVLSLSALTAFGIHRLQSLSNDVKPIVRDPNETTAEFFLRQNQFIHDVAIPIAVRVVGETFLLGALVALLGLIPVAMLSTTKHMGDE
jgi:MFS family permease